MVSIIIPVYNVEKYLDKCVASVVNQTYTNLEIILVDDGSPDNCPAMCDQWQVKDNRIKVVHQQNGGLSHARNEGLKLATGEFIGFVDSDDWIEPNMYELLLSALQETNADIAVCNFYVESPSARGKIKKVERHERKLYSSEEAMKLLIMGNIRNTVWCKIYRRFVILNISFPDGKICEDHLWTPLVLGNAKLIVYINHSLYHYVYRSESLFHNNILIVKRGFDRIEMCKQRTEFIRYYYPSLINLAIVKLQNYCCSEYINIYLNENNFDGDNKILNKIHQIFLDSGPISIRDYDTLISTFNRFIFKISPKALAYIYFPLRMFRCKIFKILIFPFKRKKYD